MPEQIEVGPSKNVSIRSVSYVAVWFRKGCDDDRLPTFRQLSIKQSRVLRHNRSSEVGKVIAASTMEQFQLWRFFPCRDF